MILEKLDELIHDAIKSHDEIRMRVLRMTKAELTKFQKNSDKWNDVVEIQCMNKIVNARKESIKQYLNANRKDLADVENEELKIVSVFLPQLPSEDIIRKEVAEIVMGLDGAQGGNLIRFTSVVQRTLQQKYPTITGKIISDILKSM